MALVFLIICPMKRVCGDGIAYSFVIDLISDDMLVIIAMQNRYASKAFENIDVFGYR